MEQTEREMKVVLAGFGAVSALGRGLEPLTKALATNGSGLRSCESLTGKGYQSTIAGQVPAPTLSALEAADPSNRQSRVFLFAHDALAQAATQAAPVLDQVPLTRRGFVLSTTKAGIDALEKRLRGEPCSAAQLRHIQPELLALDLGDALGVRGPRQCVSVACISGLLAIQQGASLIRRGAADAVFVAGVDLLSNFVLAGFTSLKSLDPVGCRPFDKNRVGLTLGEGAGAIVLVRHDLASATAPVISGWGVSNDANHLTGPSRDGSGLAAAIQRALDRAALKPREIDFIHLHGTGTSYNDAMESLAVRRVFGEAAPPLSSSKGMLGHTLGAAGVIETILCHIALRDCLLPGTPGLSDPDPLAPASLVAIPRAAERLDRVLKVNCGFGGTNSALVLERRLS